MPKTSSKPGYRCDECGYLSPKWFGRCRECQAWDTAVESGGMATPTALTRPAAVTRPALPISDVDVVAAASEPTRIPELDRVLGGGLVRGGVVLLAGEPGVGKSTLLLEVAAERARTGNRALYISGEESAAQVRLRAERVNGLEPNLFLADETDLAAVLGQIDASDPDLLVLDSIQTVASAEVDGTPGGVTQVREVAGTLIRVAKERGIPTLLVGHVTKDGSIAGPRVLEHLVDVVLNFEGDRHSTLRMVRAVKNRFGPTDEVGCFEFTDGGLVGLPDPSGLFLARHAAPDPGSCVTVMVEGRRPLLTEVQALVDKSNLSTPRRACSGLDNARVAMLLAVVSRRGGVALSDQDVYTATVGGVRIREPAADLALALAVVSAKAEIPIAPKMVAIGEVGLAGELRRVPAIGRRLSEAMRLGFTHALVPADPGPVPDGIRVKEASALDTAVQAAMTLGASRS